MIVSPNEMRKETVHVFKQINKQIEAVEAIAAEVGCDPSEVRDGNGAFMMAPLLLGKVMAISTLVELNKSENRR